MVTLREPTLLGLRGERGGETESSDMLVGCVGAASPGSGDCYEEELVGGARGRLLTEPGEAFLTHTMPFERRRCITRNTRASRRVETDATSRSFVNVQLCIHVPR